MQIKPCDNGIRFSATIQPRPYKNEVTGVYKDALKIRLTSPPSMVKPIKPACNFSSNGSASALRKSVLFRGLAEKKPLQWQTSQKNSSTKY
jgi:hypothetical protein